jgi:hypothetical protein
LVRYTLVKPIDKAFVDMTFSAPFWQFPTQTAAIKQIFDLIAPSVARQQHVYIECDMLGCEVLLVAIAKKFACKVSE